MELLIEATVGLAGAASSVALFRGVKRLLYPSQEENELYAVDGSMAGRTVLVTGANSGVGLAAAELLARKVSVWVGGQVEGEEGGERDEWHRAEEAWGSGRARKKGTASLLHPLNSPSLLSPSVGRPRPVCVS